MTSKTYRSRLAPVIVALTIAILLAACSTGTGAPAASPSDPPAMPSPAPVTPAPASPAPATPAPTEVPAADLRVDLQSTSGQDVYVDIVDRSGTIERAVTGRPAEGVSVGSGTLQVENLDARTVRLMWSDFPIDNQLRLFVDPIGVGYRFLMIQPAPTGPADAMGEDRILDLTFDREVSAAEVETFIQEGLDVPG
jgi:hypothetical protein